MKPTGVKNPQTKDARDEGGKGGVMGKKERGEEEEEEEDGGRKIRLWCEGRVNSFLGFSSPFLSFFLQLLSPGVAQTKGPNGTDPP